MRLLRMAFRSAAREPLQVLAIVVSLAVGLGSSVVVFALLDHILLAPLPYREPDRIVRVWEDWPRQVGDAELGVSYAHYLDLRKTSRFLKAVAVYHHGRASVASAEMSVDVEAAYVSSQFFSVFGMPPETGRLLSWAKEGVAEETAVIARSLWSRLFGVQALGGQSVLVNGRPYPVVGIMSDRFAFPHGATQIWLPKQPPKRIAQRYPPCVGRMRDGVTASQVAAEISSFDDADRNVRVSPIGEAVLGEVRRPLQLLGGAIAAVFFIALLNASMVQFARITRRWKDFGIRAALGGSPRQLAVELVAESLLPALAGGLLGFVVVSSSIAAIIRHWPDEIPRIHTFSVWAPRPLILLGASILLATLVMTAFSVWFVRRLGAMERLTAGFEFEGVSLRRFRFKHSGLIVSAQLTATLALLIGAGMLTRGFIDAVSTDLGYRPDPVLSALFVLPRERYPSRTAQRVAVDALLERMESLEGVLGASFSSTLPLAGKGEMTVGFPGRSGLVPTVAFSKVTPSFFRVLGLRIVQGRLLPENPVAEASLVVNESFARAYLGPQPIGKVVLLGSGKEYRVTGVVSDILQEGFAGQPRPGVYYHYLQPPSDIFLHDLRRGYLSLRVEDSPSSYYLKLRGVVEALDAQIQITWMRPMAELVAESVGRPRFWTVLSLGLALLALGFAAVALYALMSYTVSQRIPELAIRMALGASPIEIKKLVLSNAIGVVGRGVVAGVVLSVIVSALFADLVYGAAALRLATWAACVGILAAVALAAAYLPARRGAEVDPAAFLKMP